MQLTIMLLPETDDYKAEGWSVDNATTEQIEAIREFIKETLKLNYKSVNEEVG